MTRLLLAIAEVHRLGYPRNVYCELGVSIPNDAVIDTVIFERVLQTVMQQWGKTRELELLYAVYRDKICYAKIAERMNISRERVRQLRVQLVAHLSRAQIVQTLLSGITVSGKYMSGEYIWTYAVLHDMDTLLREDVSAVKEYLQSIGVIFPVGDAGEYIATLLTPSLARHMPILSGHNAEELVPLIKLDIPLATAHCLCRAGVTTLYQLQQLSAKQLMHIRGIGTDKMASICSCLKGFERAACL